MQLQECTSTHTRTQIHKHTHTQHIHAHRSRVRKTQKIAANFLIVTMYVFSVHHVKAIITVAMYFRFAGTLPLANASSSCIIILSTKPEIDVFKRSNVNYIVLNVHHF